MLDKQFVLKNRLYIKQIWTPQPTFEKNSEIEHLVDETNKMGQTNLRTKFFDEINQRDSTWFSLKLLDN